jgi:hypothetical protein
MRRLEVKVQTVLEEVRSLLGDPNMHAESRLGLTLAWQFLMDKHVVQAIGNIASANVATSDDVAAAMVH